MKPKKQRIESPTLMAMQHEALRKATGRKLKIILSITFISVIFSLLIALSLKNVSKPEFKPAPLEQPGVKFMIIKDRAIIRMSNTTIIRVTDKEWKALAKEFAHRVETNSVTFYKDPK